MGNIMDKIDKDTIVMWTIFSIVIAVCTIILGWEYFPYSTIGMYAAAVIGVILLNKFSRS
jgi:uncharacterized membrane protein YagU involved in acid resistance